MRFRSLQLAGFIISLLFITQLVDAQVLIGGNAISLDRPTEYTIGGITISGTTNFDSEAIILFTGLSVGDKVTIPGERISQAIKNLWKQQLFSDISIRVAEVRAGNVVFLNIELGERARLSRFKFNGASKGEADDLREKINLRLGTILTENTIQNTKNIITKFYVDKGFMQTKVDIVQAQDTILKNAILIEININKGERVKISSIDFERIKGDNKARVKGNKWYEIWKRDPNKELTNGQLRRSMKDTKVKKWFRLFSTSKFLEKSYKEDKAKVMDKYNARGYRNAKIIQDTVIYDPKSNTVAIKIKLEEGNKFFFRNIRWVGNTKYSSEFLSSVLGIKKGDIYNKQTMQERLVINQNSSDVSSLYLDDGYLSFQAIPVEVAVENDSIDFEIRVFEGKQYRINRIILMGNDKTNDRVVIREIRTRPGDLFNRTNIIRTQRELTQLGYFDPEKMGVNPIQNPKDGTVDIEYTVAEKPSDQVELSGGFGAGRVVGTLGLSFSNFSLRNFFKKDAWAPLPSGDGQRLSIRAQSNGTYYQGYNLSFTEPWLGGKRPNSLSVSLSHSVQTNGATKRVTATDGSKIENPLRQALLISGISVGIGKQLQWPDDYFSIYHQLSYQYYDVKNFSTAFAFSNGYSNNISYTLNITRRSDNDPIFAKSGSIFGFTLKATPPYSLFSNKDYSTLSDQQKYKFVEYHKWKFTSSWFTEITKNLVLNTRAGFGYLGKYNKAYGPAPFERYYLGGSALTGFSLDGREIIGLRGYDNYSLSPTTGGLIISKYTLEMRYLLSPNPNAKIFVLSFLEAGATWNSFRDYSPFNVKRSGGVGARVFLPMFGLLGLDYGWRFDDVTGFPNMPKGQFHFTIGMNLGEL
ncbi:MAG: POTRA domain-containing protein [Bacteroidota bacterium]